MRDPRFRYRLLLAFLLVIAVSMGLPLWYARHTLERDNLNEATRAVLREAQTLRLLWSDSPRLTLAMLDDKVRDLGQTLGMRVTVMDRNGQVLAEPAVLAAGLASMDNHLDRPEVVAALRQGTGVSVRYSATIDADLIYAAVDFPGSGDVPPGILRVAVPYASVMAQAAEQTATWFGLVALATVLALVLAFWLSARLDASLRAMIRVVEGIASGHGPRRLHLVPGREFRGLAQAVNDMADRIETNIRTIEHQATQLAVILDTMTEGVLVLDGDGRIRLANAALRRMFPEVAEGRRPVEVIPVAPLQEALDELITTGEERQHLQIEPRPGVVLDVGLACPRRDGQAFLVVAVFHDVSDIVRLLRMRRDFVANVSHELRTPLTAIQGSAETLLDLSPDDAEHRDRFLHVVLRHTRHMSRMVDDLLALSRIESGTVPMELRDVDVADFVESCMAQCRAQTDAQNQRFAATVQPGLRARLDPHFMGQVLRNLFENASRHAPEGSVITLRACQEDETVFFEVTDEGSGIPEAHRERVFERFYRVEKHRGTANGGSTGLGLAICKHVVERHKGRIWVAENTGGARFCVRIPA